ASTLVCILAGCYAPDHWRECWIQCAPTGACPQGTFCQLDGYCHKSATACASPPSFSGAFSATPGTHSISPTWNAATHPATPPSEIVYLVYQAKASGMEHFDQPTATTAPGVTSFSVPGLAVSTRYFFIVRARNLAGVADTNAVEVSAETLASSDTTPPQF